MFCIFPFFPVEFGKRRVGFLFVFVVRQRQLQFQPEPGLVVEQHAPAFQRYELADQRPTINDRCGPEVVQQPDTEGGAQSEKPAGETVRFHEADEQQAGRDGECKQCGKANRQPEIELFGLGQ